MSVGSIMKKVGSLIAAGVISIGAVTPVYAVGPFQEIKDAKKDVIEARKDLREERKDLREEIKEKISSKTAVLRKLIEGRAAIGTGKITAKGTNQLTVEKDGKSYTVNIDSNTQLRRRFWGKATLDEMAVGDMVNVIGKWTDDAHTTVLAKLIRDVSIQRRFGVFVGIVKSIVGTGFSIETVHRGTQAVTVSSSTKFTNRRGETIVQGDVAVGHRVRVSGLWDRALNTITEVTKVKDFSLPLKTTATPTATAAPTATPTP